MEERFDPETGKPIENMAAPEEPQQSAPQQVEPQVMFDAETGKPISDMAAPEEPQQPQYTAPEQAAPEQVEPQVMFDPETGKPISDMAAPEQPQQPQYTAPEQAAPQQPQYTAPEQSGVRFDPNTGMAINDQAQGSQRFDPNTGMPINDQAQGPQRFDPNTGRQINDQAQGPQRFDPNTGMPINDQAQGPQRFDPKTGRPITAAPKMQINTKINTKMIAIIGGIAVAVIIILALLPMLTLGKNYKLIKAAKNTFKPDKIVEQTHLLSILDGKKFTISGEGAYKYYGTNYSGNASYACDLKGHKQYVSGKLKAGSTEVEAKALIDKEKLAINSPALYDSTIIYNYKKDKTGYLADYHLDNYNLNLEDVDDFLSEINPDTEGDSFEKDAAAIMKKQVNSLSFHKTKSDTFTINDKDRNCKGYECKIRTSTANKWIDDYTKLYKKYTDDTTGADANSVFDDIRSSVNSYGDIDLTVYLYKNQIAAIVTEGQPGSSEYKVEFNGGSNPVQNYVVTCNGRSILQKYEYISDGIETMTYTLGTSSMKLDYEKKTGDIEIQCSDSYGSFNSFSIDGTMKGKAKKFTFEMSSIRVGGESLPAEGTITISKGAKIPSVSVKNAFDIGKANENKFNEFLKDVSVNLNKAGLGDQNQAAESTAAAEILD